MNIVEEGRFKENLMYVRYHQMYDIPPDYEILPKEYYGELVIASPYGEYPLLFAEEHDKLVVTFKEV